MEENSPSKINNPVYKRKRLFPKNQAKNENVIHAKDNYYKSNIKLKSSENNLYNKTIFQEYNLFKYKNQLEDDKFITLRKQTHKGSLPKNKGKVSFNFENVIYQKDGNRIEIKGIKIDFNKKTNNSHNFIPSKMGKLYSTEKKEDNNNQINNININQIECLNFIFGFKAVCLKKNYINSNLFQEFYETHRIKIPSYLIHNFLRPNKNQTHTLTLKKITNKQVIYKEDLSSKITTLKDSELFNNMSSKKIVRSVSKIVEIEKNPKSLQRKSQKNNTKINNFERRKIYGNNLKNWEIEKKKTIDSFCFQIFFENSACLIQRYWRNYIMMKKEKQKKSIEIQKVFRGFILRKRLKIFQVEFLFKLHFILDRYIKHMAFSLILNIYQNKLFLCNRIEKVIVIQKFVRKFLEFISNSYNRLYLKLRKLFTKKKEETFTHFKEIYYLNTKIIKIQASFRGYSLRNYENKLDSYLNPLLIVFWKMIDYKKYLKIKKYTQTALTRFKQLKYLLKIKRVVIESFINLYALNFLLNLRRLFIKRLRLSSSILISRLSVLRFYFKKLKKEYKSSKSLCKLIEICFSKILRKVFFNDFMKKFHKIHCISKYTLKILKIFKKRFNNYTFSKLKEFVWKRNLQIVFLKKLIRKRDNKITLLYLCKFKSSIFRHNKLIDFYSKLSNLIYLLRRKVVSFMFKLSNRKRIILNRLRKILLNINKCTIKSYFEKFRNKGKTKNLNSCLSNEMINIFSQYILMHFNRKIRFYKQNFFKNFFLKGKLNKFKIKANILSLKKLAINIIEKIIKERMINYLNYLHKHKGKRFFIRKLNQLVILNIRNVVFQKLYSIYKVKLSLLLRNGILKNIMIINIFKTEKKLKSIFVLWKIIVDNYRKCCFILSKPSSKNVLEPFSKFLISNDTIMSCKLIHFNDKNLLGIKKLFLLQLLTIRNKQKLRRLYEKTQYHSRSKNCFDLNYLFNHYYRSKLYRVKIDLIFSLSTLNPQTLSIFKGLCMLYLPNYKKFFCLFSMMFNFRSYNTKKKLKHLIRLKMESYIFISRVYLLKWNRLNISKKLIKSSYILTKNFRKYRKYALLKLKLLKCIHRNEENYLNIIYYYYKKFKNSFQDFTLSKVNYEKLKKRTIKNLFLRLSKKIIILSIKHLCNYKII